MFESAQHGAKRLAGRRIVITGAAGGIGLAQARLFASEGASLALFDLQHTATVAEEARNFGGHVFEALVDVRDADALEAATRSASDALGGLDGLSAGVGMNTGIGPLWSLDLAQVRQVFEVNVLGCWNTLRAVTPYLREAAPPASLVVIGSTAGMKGAANLAHYSASKHAVTGMTMALAAELAAEGIRVNMVAPTNIDTPMFQNEEVWRFILGGDPEPTREKVADAARDSHLLPISWVSPQDVATAVAFLLSEEARHVTATTLKVDGGFLAR